MQSLDAKTQYRNSFHCSARIFSEEDFLTYWKGIGPRSARTVVSLPLFLRNWKTLITMRILDESI